MDLPGFPVCKQPVVKPNLPNWWHVKDNKPVTGLRFSFPINPPLFRGSCQNRQFGTPSQETGGLPACASVSQKQQKNKRLSDTERSISQSGVPNSGSAQAECLRLFPYDCLWAQMATAGE